MFKVLQKTFLIFLVVFLLVPFAQAFDINSYITKAYVRKTLNGETKYKARIYKDKDGNEYKIPAFKVIAPEHCLRGSCNYTWSVNIPVYNGPGVPSSYKTVTGTATKTEAHMVGTVIFTKTDDGSLQYIKIRKSDGFKDSIINGDMNALSKLNQITGQYGYYYKAQIYKRQVRDIRTGEVKIVDSVRLKKVRTLEEANIEDLRNTNNNTDGGSLS